MPSMQEAFISALNSCSVVHFKDNRLDKLSPRHYYVAIPVDKNTSLLLCIITSKVEKRIAHAKRVNALSGLVKVSGKDIPELSMESVIDCNQTSLVSKRPDDLHWADVSTFKLCGVLSEDVRKKVFAAICSSPVVPPAIKALLPK